MLKKEALPEILQEFHEEILLTEREIISFDLEQQQTEISESKIFGNPYYPINRDYPTYDGKPMRLLAQINLADLPTPFYNLPQQGLLQFFGPIEYEYLIDDSEKIFKVILQDNINLLPSGLISDFQFVLDASKKYGDGFAEKGEQFFMKPEVIKDYIGMHDHRFPHGMSEKAADIIKGDAWDFVYENLNNRNTKMGGFSDNGQGVDDRVPGTFDILLFQLSALDVDNLLEMDIQFFINEKDLEHLNFEKVHAVTYMM